MTIVADHNKCTIIKYQFRDAITTSVFVYIYALCSKSKVFVVKVATKVSKMKLALNMLLPLVMTFAILEKISKNENNHFACIKNI